VNESTITAESLGIIPLRPKVYASREKIIHATSGGGIELLNTISGESNAEKEIIVERNAAFGSN
jgi:hypothetical protein